MDERSNAVIKPEKVKTENKKEEPYDPNNIPGWGEKIPPALTPTPDATDGAPKLPKDVLSPVPVLNLPTVLPANAGSAEPSPMKTEDKSAPVIVHQKVSIQPTDQTISPKPNPVISKEPPQQEKKVSGISFSMLKNKFGSNTNK